MKLKKWIEKRGMSLTEFARRIGMSKSTVSRLVGGSRRPGLDTMDKIATATDESVTARDWVRR